jgi:hypothetical protein
MQVGEKMRRNETLISPSGCSPRNWLRESFSFCKDCGLPNMVCAVLVRFPLHSEFNIVRTRLDLYQSLMRSLESRRIAKTRICSEGDLDGKGGNENPLYKLEFNRVTLAAPSHAMIITRI